MACSVHLPANIYGAAMACIVEAHLSNRRKVTATAAMVTCTLILNIVAQAYVLEAVNTYISWPSVMRVRRIYSNFHRYAFDEDGNFDQEAFENLDEEELHMLCQFPMSQARFFWAILAIWFGFAFTDIMETWFFMSCWYNLPSPAKKECQAQPTNDSPLSAGYRQTGETGGEVQYDDDGEALIVTSASRKVKVIVFCLVLLPKLVIAVLLWWIGARWLMSTTSFEGLILNGVALAFILELDEVCFKALLPPSLMSEIEQIQFRRDDFPSSKRRDAHIAIILLKVAVILGWPAMYIRYFQQVLPGYKFDVWYHCSELSGL